MEKIFGAVCYNLYRSEDGVHYRFLAKTKKSRYKTGPLPPDTMFFYKYKVSMDGTFYSDFSEVLSRLHGGRMKICTGPGSWLP